MKFATVSIPSGNAAMELSSIGKATQKTSSCCGWIVDHWFSAQKRELVGPKLWMLSDPQTDEDLWTSRIVPTKGALFKLRVVESVSSRLRFLRIQSFAKKKHPQQIPVRTLLVECTSPIHFGQIFSRWKHDGNLTSVSDHSPTHEAGFEKAELSKQQDTGESKVNGRIAPAICIAVFLR